MTGFGDLQRPRDSTPFGIGSGVSGSGDWTVRTPASVFTRAGVPAELTPVREARWLREPAAAGAPLCAGAVKLQLEGGFAVVELLDRVEGELREACLEACDEPFAQPGELAPIAVCVQPGSLELLALIGFVKPALNFIREYDRIRTNALKAVDDVARNLKWLFRGLMIWVKRARTWLHLPSELPRPLDLSGLSLGTSG